MQAGAAASGAVEEHGLSAGFERSHALLVYYAGHGMSDPMNRSYRWLVPSDGQADDPTSWVELDDFHHVFDRTQAKHVLVGLDCCYGGSAITSRGLGSTLGSAADQYTRRRAHAILTSGRGMEEVSDGAPGQSSPFARAFLEALALDRATLTSSALFVHVQAVYERERVTGQVPMLRRLPDSYAEFVFHLR